MYVKIAYCSFNITSGTDVTADMQGEKKQLPIMATSWTEECFTHVFYKYSSYAIMICNHIYWFIIIFSDDAGRQDIDFLQVLGSEYALLFLLLLE